MIEKQDYKINEARSEVENFSKDGANYLNPDYLSGDTAKYMTMYNRMAWYDE